MRTLKTKQFTEEQITCALRERRRGPRNFASFFAPVAGSLWALGFAQSACAQEEPKPALPEIIVTGSRIPVPANITATSPIQVVTSQDILLAGHTDAVDVLNSLPQNIINSGIDFGNNSNPANSVGGIATADLRGLGREQ